MTTREPHKKKKKAYIYTLNDVLKTQYYQSLWKENLKVVTFKTTNEDSGFWLIFESKPYKYELRKFQYKTSNRRTGKKSFALAFTEIS